MFPLSLYTSVWLLLVAIGSFSLRRPGCCFGALSSPSGKSSGGICFNCTLKVLIDPARQIYMSGSGHLAERGRSMFLYLQLSESAALSGSKKPFPYCLSIPVSRENFETSGNKQSDAKVPLCIGTIRN